MDIIIREIEWDDYTEILSLWNNELGSQRVTAENLAIHHERVKMDERYKTFVALHNNKADGFVTTVQSYEVDLRLGLSISLA